MLSYETTSGCKKHWKLLWKIIIRIHIANNIMTYSQFSYRTPGKIKEMTKKILRQIINSLMMFSVGRKKRQRNFFFFCFVAVPEMWGFIKHVFGSALCFGAFDMRTQNSVPILVDLETMR